MIHNDSLKGNDFGRNKPVLPPETELARN